MKVGDGGNTHTAAPKAHKRKKEMFVSLSKITSFEVGGFAHRQSWGKRCNGRKERREQSSTQVDSAGKWNSRYFSITEYLGSGHFGDIYLGVYNNENDRELHGQSVALKRFSKKRILKEAQNKGRFLELLQREINIHSSIQHPYIIPFLGFYEDAKELHMVLKHASEGDLMGFIRRLDGEKRAAIAQTVVAQVSDALSYLQQLQIAHRDIKPENVLVSRSDHFQLADFGWACWWKPGSINSTLCGTVEFVPPEMICSPRRYEARYVDAWSLGVLAWELIHGHSPFCGEDRDDQEPSMHEVFDRILLFDASSLSSSESFVSDFCSQLMRIQPDHRLSPEQALQHPFLRGQNVVQKDSKAPVKSPSVAQRCQMFQHLM